MTFQTMEQTIRNIYNGLDREWVMRHARELIRIEEAQTFSAYHRAADYVYRLLQDQGFDAEKLTFPADGKTTYQDMRTPLAWEASVGRLTVTKSPLPFADPVIADYEKMPYALVKHSVAVPEGGIRVPLVTEAQVYAGEDCRGAMVLLGPETRPRGFAIAPLLDMGALGFVSDNLVGASDTPDCTQWVNAGTDDAEHWHVQADDRDFIGFSITPRIGRKLRHAVTTGSVEVLVESDGRRYEGEIHAVTALLPGEDKRELWVIAHLYEPLSHDNSASVLCAIDSARQIRRLIEQGMLPPLKFSIRLVFAMECYGYAALAEHYGGRLAERTIGGINLDCLPVGRMDDHFHMFLTPLGTPFFGNYVFEAAFRGYEQCFQLENVVDSWDTGYTDDTFLNDSTVGLPVLMPEYTNKKCTYWHNSVRDADNLSEEKMMRVLSLIAAWVGRVTTMQAEELPVFLEDAVSFAQARLDSEAARLTGFADEADRMAFFLESEKKRIYDFRKIADIPEIEKAAQRLTVKVCAGDTVTFDGPWSSYAAGIVCTRRGVGFPFDLIKLPKNQRRVLPNAVLYGPMASILSGMDGHKNLLQLIRESAWEYHVTMNEKIVRQYVNAVLFLADAGYLTADNRHDIDKEQIVAVLKRLGISEGDTLLVHSSQSGCGHVMGGADTIIDGFLEAAGASGTVLMPSFTRPYIGFEGTVNKARSFRPFTPENIENIWTGAVSKAMARRPGAVRSAHVTHSWCGLGPRAAACLEAHGALDAPASADSPMAKALAADGKVVFFGCGLGSNTFLHFLEDQANVSYLENAIVQIEEADGRRHTEVIHRHLPGHRDFYEPVGNNAAFYRRAQEKGLEIRAEQLGAGTVYCIQLRQLYEIGMELFQADPYITLCEDPNCRYCQRHRSYGKNMPVD